MSERKNLMCVSCSGVLLGLPVLLFGFPNPSHDGQIHEVWYSNFAAQFWSGDLYPRWLQNLNGGLGSPCFYFYPPVPFFITSLFQPFFQGAPHSWRILGFSAGLALLLSGVLAYLWLRQLTGGRAATFAAILYMAVPYHFTVDLHLRGAFAELWSFVWMPLVLFFAHRPMQRRAPGLVGLAVSYALLVMTHLPTTLMFSLVPPAYAICTCRPNERMRSVCLVIGSMALGVGLASLYLVPAMLDQGAVSMQAMRTGFFVYENGFFLPHPNWANFQLARSPFEWKMFWMVLATAGVGANAWFLALRAREEPGRRQCFFWAAVAVLSLVMMFPLSKPIYQLLPPLQLIQFPWRFNAVLVVAVAALLAFGLDSIKPPCDRAALVALGSVAALLLLWGAFAVGPIMHTSLSANPHLAGPASDWKANNWDTPEYKPKWVSTDVRRLVRQWRMGGAENTKARCLNDSSAVLVQKWKPRHITLAVAGTNNIQIRVGQFYYPGWTATLDNKAILPVEPSVPEGLVQVQAPAGTHTVELVLGKSKAEAAGRIISLISALVLLVLSVLGKIRRRFASQPTRRLEPVPVPTA